MNTHEIDFSPAPPITEHEIRRRVEKLLAQQAVRIFQGLARLISTGYSRLATHGAELNAGLSRGLF